jgi:hypothetical protein
MIGADLHFQRASCHRDSVAGTVLADGPEGDRARNHLRAGQLKLLEPGNVGPPAELGIPSIWKIAPRRTEANKGSRSFYLHPPVHLSLPNLIEVNQVETYMARWRARCEASACVSTIFDHPLIYP